MFTFVYDNIWVILLSIFILYISYDLLKPIKKQTFVPIVHEPEREFSLDQLSEYNGILNKKVYVCIMGTVFDVSSSGFYSPSINDIYIYIFHTLILFTYRRSISPFRWEGCI